MRDKRAGKRGIGSLRVKSNSGEKPGKGCLNWRFSLTVAWNGQISGFIQSLKDT